MSQGYGTGAKRARATGAALALTLGYAFAHLAAAQDAGTADSPPLRAGETQRATQRAADRVSFVIDLERRGDYLLRVAQGGLDLVVTLTEPGGSSESFNSPLLRNEAELVLLADRPVGRYEVVLYSDEHSDTIATPALELLALAPSSDPREREALQAMSRGAAANFAGGEEAWRSAVTEYERAAELWRSLDRRREEAQALFAGAIVEFWQLYAWQRSAELAERAATLYAALDEPSLAASAVELRASALVEQALEAGEKEPAEAETLFARAVALFEEARLVQQRLGNGFALGSIVNNLGYVAYNRGKHDEARRYYQQAAAVLAAAGEPGAELNPLANLAVLDVEAGRAATAIDTLERILAVLPPGKQERYRSDTMFNLGTSVSQARLHGPSVADVRGGARDPGPRRRHARPRALAARHRRDVLRARRARDCDGVSRASPCAGGRDERRPGSRSHPTHAGQHRLSRGQPHDGARAPPDGTALRHVGDRSRLPRAADRARSAQSG